MKRRKTSGTGDISKKELMEAYDRLKKKTGKKTSPVADRKSRIGGRKELIDAYAKLKDEE